MSDKSMTSDDFRERGAVGRVLPQAAGSTSGLGNGLVKNGEVQPGVAPGCMYEERDASKLSR
ncbi:MAG: hypothetical protein ACD_75C00172G0004 [uncultured bacterium]|nr:MAG: hypothetical protein ACD_75C00172G0004 [uncultured bacterium]